MPQRRRAAGGSRPAVRRAVARPSAAGAAAGQESRAAGRRTPARRQPGLTGRQLRTYRRRAARRAAATADGARAPAPLREPYASVSPRACWACSCGGSSPRSPCAAAQLTIGRSEAGAGGAATRASMRALRGGDRRPGDPSALPRGGEGQGAHARRGQPNDRQSACRVERRRSSTSVGSMHLSAQRPNSGSS